MNKKNLAIIAATSILVAGISYAAFTGMLLEALDYARDGDADADGMPTRWELKHDLDPLRDDRYEDLDADQVFNVDEHARGLAPNDADTDGDRVIDGEDRDALNRTRVELETLFAPGLLSFNIPANVTLLACHAYSAGRVGGGPLHDRGQDECLESPEANEIQARRLHELADKRWKTDDVYGGTVHPRTGRAWWYNDTVGPTKYAVQYWPNTQAFSQIIHNVAPVPLNDTHGRAFVYMREPFDIPADAPSELTIEVQGYAPGGAPSFDVRFYGQGAFEPGGEEDRRIVLAQALGHGGYRAHIPISNLASGHHTLVLIPIALDLGGKVTAPADTFEIHSIGARYVEATLLQTTNEPLEGLDEAPAAIIEKTMGSVISGEGSGIDTLVGLNAVATVVESFATLGLIPDASIAVDAKVGGLASNKLASTRTLLVTHEAGSGYVVTTHTQSLVKKEGSLKLVTRTTSAEYGTLPKKLAEAAGEGLLRSSAHAVVVATEVAHDGLVLLQPVKGEAETLAKAGVKLQAGLAGSETILSEAEPRAVLAKVALRGVVGGLALFSIFHMAEDWTALTHAQGPEELLRAWSGLIAGGVGLATLVLPLGPVLLAIGALISLVLELVAYPELIPKILDTAANAFENAGGHIPGAIQRKLYIQAINDHAATATAKAAPIFFGQFNETGSPITPKALEGSTEYNGAWGWLALILMFLVGAALIIGFLTGRIRM